MKPHVSSIHENIKTLLDKRTIQKKKKKKIVFLNVCITVMPRTVTRLGMYGQKGKNTNLNLSKNF